MINAGTYYVVKTNLDPQTITRIGLYIFAKWLDYALGGEVLGGHRIVYPTGRYAASLRFQQTGEASVAIIADESVAPEAAILEHGHGAVDLKNKLRSGVYKMHRPVASNRSREATGLNRVGSGPPGLKPSMWAELRQRESSGYASIGPNSAPGSWIIPPMPAYSPALILSAIAERMAQGMQT